MASYLNLMPTPRIPRSDANRLKGKQLALAFFTQKAPGSSTWVCRCGKERIQNGSGYTNMCSHITQCHPEHLELYAGGEHNELILRYATIPKKSKTIFDWLKWVTELLLPFSFVANQIVRRYTNLDPISRTTFMKYLGLCTSVVEQNIREKLPDAFALVFDGWSHGSTHYVAVFATFPSDHKLEVIRASGNNNYRIPHVRKAALSRQGVLPEVVVAEKDVIESRLRLLLSATDVEAKVIELSVEVANWLEMGDICSQLEQLVVVNEDDEIDMLELLQLNIEE
ncbi:hypothetical protein H257_10811 [Aphanomyces astaci]|uniref:DUF659 domain-containing protein n=1 Tax=Aphanomyces astaci TaxID=112090 RepID=W4G4U5_APHAT|nr:hypothetical protein H257_10811 [Aphanomyces astaci]ETV74695.1 hypothetical protein H257_10811 [Aphanomyces astaci]|eukprot:XP_009835782.1 hypothetical protein H257_10811 [Aphanomyces astaci]